MLRMLMCGLIAGTLLGCANQARTSDPEADWPVVSIQVRAMLVSPEAWEEFGLSDESDGVSFSQIKTIESHAISSAIDEVEANLHITCVLANQNSICITSPRLTVESGSTTKTGLAFDIVMLNDQDRQLSEPPLILHVTPQIMSLVDGTERVQMTINGDWMPPSVFEEYAERNPNWAQTREQPQFRLRPGFAFDVNFEVASYQTQLIALPGYVSDQVYAYDPDRRKYLVLLIRSTVVHSAEEERALFPGLEDEFPFR